MIRLGAIAQSQHNTNYTAFIQPLIQDGIKMDNKGIGSYSWFPSTAITAKKQYHSGHANEELQRRCTTIYQNTRVTQIRGNDNFQWARVLNL